MLQHFGGLEEWVCEMTFVDTIHEKKILIKNHRRMAGSWLMNIATMVAMRSKSVRLRSALMIAISISKPKSSFVGFVPEILFRRYNTMKIRIKAQTISAGSK